MDINIPCLCQYKLVPERKDGFWDSLGMQSICGRLGGPMRDPSALHPPRSSPQGKKIFGRQWLISHVLEILFPAYPLKVKRMTVDVSRSEKILES